MIQLSVNNIFRNNARSSNKVTLEVYEGVLTGNIIDEVEEVITVSPTACMENSLDFSCPENSQYIPLL